MKRRMAAVAGIIVIVVLVAFAVVGGATSAKVVSVSEAASSSMQGQKVQVTGTVVDNSYNVDENGVLTFSLCDESASIADAVAGKVDVLRVSYDKGVSSTFGNGISAICTGKIGEDGTLVATELVTKCPSKYESASEALSVDDLLGYGSQMVGKTVKLEGKVTQTGVDTVQDAVRFTLGSSQNSNQTIPVQFEGALPEEAGAGSSLVAQGALDEDGKFHATSVALGE